MSAGNEEFADALDHVDPSPTFLRGNAPSTAPPDAVTEWDHSVDDEGTQTTAPKKAGMDEGSAGGGGEEEGMKDVTGEWSDSIEPPERDKFVKQTSPVDKAWADMHVSPHLPGGSAGSDAEFAFAEVGFIISYQPYDQHSTDSLIYRYLSAGGVTV